MTELVKPKYNSEFQSIIVSRLKQKEVITQSMRPKNGKVYLKFFSNDYRCFIDRVQN